MNAREFDQKVAALISEVASAGEKGPSLPTVIGILEMHQQFLISAYNAGTAQQHAKPAIIPVKVLPRPTGEARS